MSSKTITINYSTSQLYKFLGKSMDLRSDIEIKCQAMLTFRYLIFELSFVYPCALLAIRICILSASLALVTQCFLYET